MVRTIPFYQSLLGKGTINEILLYGLIEVLSIKEGFCYASNGFLASQLNLSVGTVANLISSLKKKNWIQVSMVDEKHREYMMPNLDIKVPVDEEDIHSSVNTYSLQNDNGIHSRMNKYNKEDNLVINNKDKSLLLASSGSESYGNENINKMISKWESVFGYKIKNDANNRRAVYNMLRAKDKGEVWLVQTLSLLSEAQKDRYAGKEINGISNYADLQRNYEKVWKWGSSKYKQTQREEFQWNLNELN